ncbi:MAG: hypothetical protein COS82_04725 [Zetaproteobacteria bacterium CG06_land_8_20_14_3_00_59_53]|nr:MAG: hypothetical protein AUK36_08050 [Zetaproteobacteria bacterium CG2_30_59_37]PIO88923.1 MAG: hypothetical protein COX56_10830 [Zetaproteobacteria bacterium CG23_combo_of_CG06-09_8_20_14_all_59_86]PIQ65226.1 MAG: hypothetical protein COV97_05410 [Zetaproteobacteria bacterium CG11_big_fil_rev_8_21_14_0_20_59_439]PIU70804.1 MAG: hypothetical protein COS82_04725 [Zetaproteobacteria bacterium CG06_land_8_20_14_3_00_59_53]PIU96476.1 MAG: hypothetical protein COS62_09060 [Zetaproteobacteria bac
MKKVLIGVAVLLLIVVGAVLYVGSNLDGIIKTAIETYGSKATQTQVSVADVKINLQDGAGSISGLNVGNPKGFTDANIFQLGAIRTKIDTKSLTGNPIVIDELVISAPQVFYEIDKSGASNVDALKRNLQASMPASSSEAKAEKPAGGEEMKMVIRRLVVEGGQAGMRIAALGDKQQSVRLPRIELTDIGKKSGGATALEVAQLLSDAMLKNVKGAVMGAGVQQYLGKSVDELKQNLQKGALDKLGGAAGGSGDQIGGALKGLMGK